MPFSQMLLDVCELHYPLTDCIPQEADCKVKVRDQDVSCGFATDTYERRKKGSRNGNLEKSS